jgi:CheY-like chemotaxis protein
MPQPILPSPVRILLVDDNALGLAARKSVLEEQGYRVTTASEGKEGLEHLDRHKFDLLITDYKMPRMNGRELIARVRQRFPDMPIVLISGYTEALGLNEANTGADAVIAKSANEVQQMLRVVSRLLKRSIPKKPAGSQRAKAKAQAQGG